MLRSSTTHGVSDASRVHVQASRGDAEVLNAVACELAAELDLHALVQKVIDAGRELTGAACAAFFYESRGEDGEPLLLQVLSGAPREAFDVLRVADPPLLDPESASRAPIRISDVSADARCAPDAAGNGRARSARVRSCLAVPVVSRRGVFLGELLLGHPERGVFTERAEQLVVGLAAQAAVAIDNARLYGDLQRELEQRRRAEAALRESEQRLTKLISIMPVAMCACDMQGRITHFNRSAVEIWGREPQPNEPLEAFRSGFIVSRLDGTPIAYDQTALAVAIREGRGARTDEAVLERSTGVRLTLSVSVEPFFDDDGRQIGAVCVFQDITERKVDEVALRRSEQAHRRLLQNLPAAIYLCDAHGRIQMYNDAAAELWGRSPAIGEDVWCGSHRIYRQDGSPIPLDRCPMAVAIQEGRPVRGEELVIERPDGTRRHVLPHPEPLRDENGRVVGAINMLVDVTDRHLAAEARGLLAAIVDSSGDAIVSKTLDGRITSWNAGAQRMFGYTPAEAIGGHITMLIPKRLWSEERDILARLGRGERIEHFETERVRKDGRTVNVSLTVSPVRDASGKVVGASKVARDITSRRRHEEEIARLNASLRDHVRELQTLLNVLPIGVFIAHDAECRRITANAAGSEMLRLSAPDANVSKTAAGLEPERLGFRVFREGVEVPDEELPMQRCARTGEVIAGEEYEVVFEDGSCRNLYEFATPLLNAEGQIRGCVAAFVDITDRKHHEAQMRLVMAELNHRVKNTLAVVDATAQQTLRHSPDMEAFAAAFGSRLRALAQAHGLLTQTDWQGAELTGLALAELRPRVDDPSQVQLSGPAVVLRPNAALALHMVLHELSTNAVKYGALSAPDGRVRLDWQIGRDRTAGMEGEVFELTWVEAGGPAVVKPQRHGFGTKVLTRTIAHELQGDVSVDFTPSGVRCVIRFPWTGRVGFIAQDRTERSR